ncbi:MAG: hypothetical protein WC464_03360 [Bdellovibrionales bacterium]
MTAEWVILFAGVAALSAAGCVLIAVIWLRKLRETVIATLTETAGQQILTAQHLSESIARLQKQQDNYAQQVQTLAQAGLRLQQEISNVSNRLTSAQTETHRGGQTLH